MKQRLLHILLNTYNNHYKKDKLRKFLKKTIADDEIIVRFNGFRIHAKNSSAIESSIIFDHYPEHSILGLIKKYALKGYSMIDIGANIGLHSITAATSNKAIEIFSFEPEPTNFLGFIKNIALNGVQNIRPFRMGLGNSIGNNVLNINQGWNKGKHSMKVDFDENSHQKINIPVTTLNTFKEHIIGDNYIVKIDVEGFEKEVIEGANELLERFVNCILIIELVAEINGEVTCIEITAALKKHNFNTIYKIVDGKFLSVKNYEGSADYVFLKGGEAVEVFSEEQVSLT